MSAKCDRPRTYISQSKEGEAQKRVPGCNKCIHMYVSDSPDIKMSKEGLLRFRKREAFPELIDIPGKVRLMEKMILKCDRD